MLTITPEQLAAIDRSNAFMRLHQFVKAKCKNKAFVLWLDQQFATLAPTSQWPKSWEKIWSDVAELPEVNAMLMLVFTSVCEYEKKPQRPIADLVHQLENSGVRIRSYFEQNNYFRYSDFDIDLDAL